LQEVFLTRTNSILTENNVLDEQDYNIDYFLLRNTSVPSTQLNRPNMKKESLSSPAITKFPDSVLFNN
jgi:hypothetical protein